MLRNWWLRDPPVAAGVGGVSVYGARLALGVEPLGVEPDGGVSLDLEPLGVRPPVPDRLGTGAVRGRGEAGILATSTGSGTKVRASPRATSVYDLWKRSLA
jgi:hypothetical protein